MKQIILVVAVVGTLFAILQFSNPSLIGDDDVYWHIRYSANILDTGNLSREFFGKPIPYAGVLFHLVLAPFTLIPNLFVAQKIAGIVFACVIAMASYLLLKKFEFRYPAIFTIAIFFLSVNFTFRLLLVRTFLLSIILLLAGAYCIFNRKHFLLYIVAILYGLSYSIPFLFLLAAFWTIAKKIAQPKTNWDWKIPALTTAGIITGVILHPVFPDNVTFLKEYVLPVLYRVPIGELNGGVELQPFSLMQFIRLEWMVLLIWFCSMILFFWNYRLASKKAEKLFLVLVSASFFVMALMFRRFIEYWALFATLAAFFIFKPYLDKIDLAKAKELMRSIWQMQVAALLLAVLLSVGGYQNIRAVYLWAIGSPSHVTFEKVGEWMNANIPPGSTIFNVDWAQYPKLYFYDSSAEYVAKFDPAYLYLQSPDRYSQWRKIANDEPAEWTSIQELYGIMHGDFHAQYLILKNRQNVDLANYIDQEDFDQNLFQNIYQDQDFTVYLIKS